MRTTGYKRQQVHFQDLLYENYRRAGSATSDQNTQVPAGIFIGSGVKTVSTGRVMTQGNLTSTEKHYDVAIRGEGFFRIRMPDGRTTYTRDGSFDLDSQGQLVTRDGYLVEPGITIPQQRDQRQHQRPGHGRGDAAGPDGAAAARPDPARALRQQGRAWNRSATTCSSRRPPRASRSTASGGGEGFGTLQQNYLEEGNVKAVTELSSLIAAQRAYEMNSKVITAADQMMSATTQMFRG